MQLLSHSIINVNLYLYHSTYSITCSTTLHSLFNIPGSPKSKDIVHLKPYKNLNRKVNVFFITIKNTNVLCLFPNQLICRFYGRLQSIEISIMWYLYLYMCLLCTFSVQSQLPVQRAVPSGDTPRQLTRFSWAYSIDTR